MPYQLKTIQVVVCGETLTVSQASNAMDVERTLRIGEAEDAKTAAEDQKGRYVYYMTSLLYPSLAACTIGNVPTLDEFLYGIPFTESDAWVLAAKELNPQWFSYVANQEESVEKKE